MLPARQRPRQTPLRTQQPAMPGFETEMPLHRPVKGHGDMGQGQFERENPGGRRLLLVLDGDLDHLLACYDGHVLPVPAYTCIRPMTLPASSRHRDLGRGGLGHLHLLHLPCRPARPLRTRSFAPWYSRSAGQAPGRREKKRHHVGPMIYAVALGDMKQVQLHSGSPASPFSECYCTDVSGALRGRYRYVKYGGGSP
jgi:hypothetical protein